MSKYPVLNKRPFRRVVSSKIIRLPSTPNSAVGTRVETLECEHKIAKKASVPTAKRRRCHECRMIQIGAYEVDLRWHAPDELASDDEPPILSAAVYCNGRVHVVLDYLDPFDEDVSWHDSLSTAQGAHKIQFVYDDVSHDMRCKCEESRA